MNWYRSVLVIMICFLLGLGLTFVVPVVAQQPQPEIQTQMQMDEQLVRQEYERVLVEQGAQGISVSNVAVVGDYALLFWFEENGGGQALLTRKAGVWTLVRGVGGAFSAQELVNYFNVPAEIAPQLIQKLMEGAQP